MERRRKLVFGAAALLAAAGGGVAIAASDSSPKEENQAIIDAAAKQLGISSTRLSNALERALANRVDAAVAAGRLTKEEGEALKQRIGSDGFPLFRALHGRGFGHFGFSRKLHAAAEYLGLTAAQLRSELESGKSLAQIAQAHGKSVSGLVDALVAAAKQRIDAAVAGGRLTRSQADEMLNGLRDRIESRVNATGPDAVPHFGRPRSGFHRFSRPPA